MADQLPAPLQVRETLSDLLGREVTVALEDPPAGESIPVVAVFVHDSLALAGLIGFDLPLAANIAAAIGLVPPGGAEAAVEDGELSSMLGDNLTEVCNVHLRMGVAGRADCDARSEVEEAVAVDIGHDDTGP